MPLTPSEAFRFRLSSFRVLSPMPRPLHTCTGLEEAVDWMAAEAREPGIAARF